MKRILILIFLAPFIATAQNKPLIIEGTSPNLYVTHTVAPKENYYSIGRMYNISPKEIAPFNKLELGKGLSLNQVIKVPLMAVNFSQDAVVTPEEALVPLYHVVKEKEGLYRIGTSYNKLPVETLKKWNNISADAVSNGTKLVVGYLKVKKDLSPLSGMAKVVTPPPAENKAVVKEEGTKTNQVKETTKPDVAKETEKKPEVKVVKEKETPAKKEDKPVVTTPPAVKNETTIAKKEEKVAPPVNASRPKDFNGGFFKNIFSSQTKNTDMDNEAGTAAVFKSTSGWEDGKYYCLHNSAAPGTIVKITSSVTGKSVYAKVLDVMPDIKQNNGVLIRISNAAAAELGQEDSKFDCSLSFSK